MIREIKATNFLTDSQKELIRKSILESYETDIDFMIDIETTGKECDGFTPIVSLALVPFSKTKTFDELSVSVKMEISQYDDPRRMRGIVPHSSMSTISWWMEQTKEAQKEFLDGSSDLRTTITVIKQIVDEVKNITKGNPKMYAKSPDFDLTILHRWARGLNLLADFSFVKYNDARCVRTVKSEALKRVTDVDRFLSSFPSGGDLVKHNPLVDCFLQIEQVQYCWNYSDE